MENIQNLEIYYWEKMNAIIIPYREYIFFEGVEPFVQISSKGFNSKFIYTDDYVDKWNLIHWVVWCPRISDKVKILISKRELEKLPLDTKEDIYNIMKLIKNHHPISQKAIEEIIESVLNDKNKNL